MIQPSSTLPGSVLRLRLARIWHAGVPRPYKSERARWWIRPLTWPFVFGAGEGNRTPTVSLGI
jgi:hypothetical protein